jgi:hypothetical protein
VLLVPMPTDDEWDAYRLAIREEYAKQLGDLRAMIEAVDAALGSGEAKPTHTLVEEIVLGHLSRATSIALDVRVLCENGRPNGALALARVFAECLASLAYLVVDPERRDERAERFQAFGIKEGRAEAELDRRVGWAEGAKEIEDAIARLPPTRTRFTFAEPQLGWTGLRTPELANAIQPLWSPEKWKDMAVGLRLAQHWGNQQLHIGSVETFDAVYVEGRDRSIDLRGDPVRIRNALNVTCGVYVEVLRLSGEQLGMASLTAVPAP